jgi:hypothetical protein
MIAMHAVTHSRHASAQVDDMVSPCLVHSSAQAAAVVIIAWSIAIIDGVCIAMGRSSMRIVVPAMSAVFMHIDMDMRMSSPIMASEHMVHACSQAEQASIQRWRASMSMPVMGVDITSVIVNIGRSLSLGRAAGDRRTGAST